MTLVLLNTAVVVAAKAHNPTILHPSFLHAKKIVPEEWELAASPVSTPAISIVKYSNGVVFVAENSKFVVQSNSPREPQIVAGLAREYLKALPHVHNSAVGINFDGYVECPQPESWVNERFLKPGPGNDDKLKPSAVGLKLVYPVPGGDLNLSCDIGTVRRSVDKSEIPCLLIAANYHIPVSEVSIDEAITAIDSFECRLAHFKETVDSIFGFQIALP